MIPASIVVSLLLLPADVPVPVPKPRTRTAPSRAGLSWAEADSLGRKLAAIEQRAKEGGHGRQTIQVTQGELNSYLNLTYAADLPRGLSDVDVRFGRARIEARGQVDIDQVRGAAPSSSSWSPLSFLAGRVPVELAGRLVSQEEGFGAIEWESVYVASIRVPISVLEDLVVSATRSEKNPQGFDIHAPFRLPYSVNRVRVEPGRAFLDF